MCPGPPLSQNRMTLRRLDPADAAADSRSLSKSGSAIPPSPSTPAWTKLRLVIPSRSPALPAKTLSIADGPPLHRKEFCLLRLREWLRHVKRPRSRFKARSCIILVRRLTG